MAETVAAQVGAVIWRDLTVNDAARVREFYDQVVEWKSSPVDMGGYDDFNMLPPNAAKPVAGICHARGTNADLPPQWLLCIIVEDVDFSAAACARLGGRIVAGPRPLSGGRFRVIADPAGAVRALYPPPRA